MAVDVVGEIAIRFFGHILMELFLFRVCRVIGWFALKMVTFGVYPAGKWKEQKEIGGVSLLGLSIVVGAFILLVLYVR